MRLQPNQMYGNVNGPEEANFSKLIERVDNMNSEETKIMTFKSQDNGFLQPGFNPEGVMTQGPSDYDQRFYGAAN